MNNINRTEGETPEGPTKHKKIITKIISWFKGKKKQKELQNIEPDKNFTFEENYYGKIEIIEGFQFIYCNNYNKIFYEDKNNISFISCIVSLPKNDKTIKDLINFINLYINLIQNKLNNIKLNNYNNINININNEKINIFLRGNMNYYIILCSYIYNNIITKYIRNNLFPNELNIDCPNEYLNNIYNSITYPCKEIDILFIENNILCKDFNPVIGLSIDKNCNKINIEDKNYIYYNNRIIIYCSIDKLSDEELQYITNNINYGNKLLDLIHIGITEDYVNIDLDIDEIIE